MIYDNDADLTKLDGKTVAILGFGSQGHAHALNLKDSGVDVVVGLRPDSSSVAKAEAEGLKVVDIAEAASLGDVVMVLLPDERQGQLWQDQISDGIAPGNLLLFAHGFAIVEHMHRALVVVAKRRGRVDAEMLIEARQDVAGGVGPAF